MDPDSLFTLILMLGLIVISAYFSATEMAFSSLNIIRIKTMAEDGNAAARRVYRLSEKFDTLLTTVLIGNNIVNIALASIATVFFVENISENHGATLATLIITLTVLIFGEISPKTLAKEHAEKFAMTTAPLIQAIMVLFTPLNFLFISYQKLLWKLFKSGTHSGITEDELLTIVDEAQRGGEFDEQESELIRSAIEFNNVEAIDIYTPRVDIVGIEEGSSNTQIAKMFAATGFSRLPVYNGTIDNITGVIHLKDFYNHVYNRSTPVEEIIKEPLFITGSMKVDDLLEKLQKEKQHMAVIVDEYGGTQGIVTMEDILEELVGEIWDEHDDIVNDIEQLGDDYYSVLSSMDFSEFCEFFGIESDSQVATVGGWVMDRLGSIPKSEDRFKYGDLEVDVVSTEEKRAVTLLVHKLTGPDDKTKEQL